MNSPSETLRAEIKALRTGVVCNVCDNKQYVSIADDLVVKILALTLNKLPEKYKQQLETTEDEITWCLTCEQILNNDGDCWCEPKNDALDTVRQLLEQR